jgi:DNA-binding winged helix-turn-helix (wHTH) protein/predicted ATPase
VPPELHRIFGPFRFDARNAQLWRDKEPITLRPKTFDVLRYLVDHPSELVTKAALLDAVWPKVSVSDSMPATCVAELRRALRDDAKTPRFIETVHRRGYRFIAKVTAAAMAPATRQSPPDPVSPKPVKSPEPIIVGRKAELEQLQGWYVEVLGGQRRVIFVAGEAGIGKSTFVQAFLEAILPAGVRIGRGQCLEQYGAGEPYMPVLEALSRLSRERDGGQVVEVLSRFAPTWLAQMPELLSREERARLQSEIQGITQQRMLREMTQALEALAAEVPLVLLLEDLHWSDFSTLELISALARRNEPARLLLVGTYRPVEILASDHRLRTLKQELELHHYCEELRLKLLSEEHVVTYLAKRFNGNGSGRYETLAPVIHARTDGNPLFLVNVVDYLLGKAGLAMRAQEVSEAESLVASGFEPPRNIREMIERNLERLKPEEQAVLEGASVAGPEFSAASVAAALERPQDEIEACCVQLSRREQFVSEQGPVMWPDGTIATGFRFNHALYQEVLYRRMPAGHQLRLHRLIALREEAGYGARAGEVATELAYHYSRANDRNKAIEYFRLAGERAVARGALMEAAAQLNRGLDLIESMPEAAERWERELALQTTLGPVLIATKGYAAQEVRTVYARAHLLCQQVGSSSQIPLVLFGLFAFYVVRAEHEKALELAERLLRVAEGAQDRALLVQAHNALGLSLFFQGNFAASHEHLERCLGLYDPQQHSALSFWYAGQDPRVTASAFSAWAFQASGYPDMALARTRAALSYAQQLSHPYSLAYAEGIAAGVHQFRREAEPTRDLADAGLNVATEQGFPFWSAFQTILLGWVSVNRGNVDQGIEHMRRGMEAYLDTGAELLRPYFIGLLAEAFTAKGSVERGLTLLDEALGIVDKTGECFYEAELYRQKGELLVRSHSDRRESHDLTAQASPLSEEECFLKAATVAQRQQAKWFELRSAMNLARLWQRQGRIEEGHRILAQTYNWFTEGFDTADLKDAKTLLEELAG